MNFGQILNVPGRILGAAGGLVGNFAGGMLGSMAKARAEALYGHFHDAARRDDTTADWRADLMSAQQTLVDELDTMLARSRHLVANDFAAASAQGGFRRLVVGGGITARSAARHPDTGEMLDTFNADLDRLWAERQSTPELIDAEDNKTGAEKQQLWMNELFVAGGLFINKLYLPADEGTTLLLQEIEYEQRDETVQRLGNNLVRGGIEVGERGQAIAYHLFTAAHPLEEFASRSVRVPVARCHHMYRQDRVRQRLGAPWMRPVMIRMRNLAMYETFTMIQAKTRAAFPGFMKQTAAAAPGMLPDLIAKQLSAAPRSGSARTDELKINLAPGTFPILKPGLEPYFPDPGTPDMMYPPYVLEQMKAISAGTGLDLPTVMRWYADGNFNTQRRAQLEIQADVEWIQDLLFIQKVLARDRRDAIEMWIRDGRLRATGFFQSPRWRTAYLSTNWQGPPVRTVDEIKDEAAWTMRFASLRGTPQEYFNQHGRDIRDVYSEWQEARRLAGEFGLSDVLDRMLQVGRPAGLGIPAAGRQPADPTQQDGDPSAGSGPNDQENLAGTIARQAMLDSLLNAGDDGHGNGSGHGRQS
jgi:lambda family phage portal protein